MFIKEEIDQKIEIATSNDIEIRIREIFFSNNPKNAFYFGLNEINNKDFNKVVNKIEKIIINSKDIKYIYLFYKYIKSCNSKKIEKIFNNSKNKKIINELDTSYINNKTLYSDNNKIKNLLLNTYDINPMLLINYIQRTKNNYYNYNNFVKKLLNIMKNDIEKYEIFLTIYIEYIINPYCSYEQVESLNNEYNKLIENKIFFQKRLNKNSSK